MKIAVSLCIAALAWTAPAAAQDPARGKLLYETHCGECHYERVHERPGSRSLVKNLSDLRDQVARRAPLTRHRFSLDEIEAVVQYLNASHYRLEK